MTSHLLLFLLLQFFCVYCNLLGFDDFAPQFFDINIDRSNPEKIYKEFEDFIVKYKRNYKDEKEKKMRFNNFVKSHNTIGKIQSQAKKAGSDATFGVNHFADLSDKEFKNTLSKIPPGNYSKIPYFNMTKVGKRSKRQLDGLPVNFDLRKVKVGGRYVIGPVKDQGHCGCCWAFAATALAEAALSVHKKKTKVLSDQEVCDCGAKKVAGCDGGDPILGLEYISEMGQTLESEYPYVDGRSKRQDVCEAEEYERALDPFMLTFYHIDPFNAEYQIMQTLYKFKTPVAVAFRIGEMFKMLAEDSGVLEMNDCDEEKTTGWHSGVIVGWGTRKNTRNGKMVDYWIFKNSWDSDWAQDGYAMLARGTNWCDIESHGVGGYIPE